MKKIWKTIKNGALYLWQLPQNIAGYTLCAWYDGKLVKVQDALARVSCDMRGGISLGRYIVVRKESDIKHEYGHVVQSKILGPLYLFVIGLPSIIHAAIDCKTCKKKGYYHFYTEKWANCLADKYYHG